MSDGQALVTTRRSADLLAVSLMFVFVLVALTLSLMPVVTSELRTAVGLTDAQIGLLTSIFMGCYGVAGIASGFSAARWGGRLLGVSCGCLVAGSFLFALSSGFAGLLAGRAIQGLGGGMVVAISNPVLAQNLPPERVGRAWGIIGMGFGLGSMVALFGMPPIQAAGGYRAVFLVTAGLSLLIGLVVLAQKAIRATPDHALGATSLRGLLISLGAALTNRQVLILGITNAAGLALGVGSLAWAPSLLQDVHGAPATTSVYVIAGLGAAQVIGNPTGVWAAGRWGKLRVIVTGLTVMLVATAVTGFMPGVAPIALLVTVGAFFGMFLFPAMVSFIPEVVTKLEHIGPATGLNTSLGFVGSLLAPWIFGLILDAGRQSKGAYVTGFLVLAVFGVVALVALAFFKKPARGSTNEGPGQQQR